MTPKVLAPFVLLFAGFIAQNAAFSHPHYPAPREVPREANIRSLSDAKAIPMDATEVHVDGGVAPSKAKVILEEIARRPLLEALHIYRATGWKGDDLAPISGMTSLRELSLSDDADQRKTAYWTHIGKAKELRRLYLHLSGD